MTFQNVPGRFGQMARHCYHRLAMPIWLIILHSPIEPNHMTGAHRFLMRYHHLGSFYQCPLQKSIAFDRRQLDLLADDN
jgi:hypothetical protein